METTVADAAQPLVTNSQSSNSQSYQSRAYTNPFLFHIRNAACPHADYDLFALGRVDLSRGLAVDVRTVDKANFRPGNRYRAELTGEGFVPAGTYYILPKLRHWVISLSSETPSDENERYTSQTAVVQRLGIQKSTLSNTLKRKEVAGPYTVTADKSEGSRLIIEPGSYYVHPPPNLQRPSWWGMSTRGSDRHVVVFDERDVRSLEPYTFGWEPSLINEEIMPSGDAESSDGYLETLLLQDLSKAFEI